MNLRKREREKEKIYKEQYIFSDKLCIISDSCTYCT